MFQELERVSSPNKVVKDDKAVHDTNPLSKHNTSHNKEVIKEDEEAQGRHVVEDMVVAVAELPNNNTMVVLLNTSRAGAVSNINKARCQLSVMVGMLVVILLVGHHGRQLPSCTKRWDRLSQIRMRGILRHILGLVLLPNNLR